MSEHARLRPGEVELKSYRGVSTTGDAEEEAIGGVVTPRLWRVALVFTLLVSLALLSFLFTSLKYSTFDVVIIGAGPSGSVVAWHLAEASLARVLVIEAGGPSQRATGGHDYLYENLTIFDVPLAWSYVAHLKDYHWPLHGALLAKAVGGCGMHNAMLYVRALQENVEGWNVSSFSWSAVYSAYLALEKFTGPLELAGHHGTGGPMVTSMSSFADLLGRKFMETTVNMGIPTTPDFNAPGGRFGAGYYTFNIRNGVRHSAAVALLQPSLERHASRVSLRTFTTVDRLELREGASRRVVAVHGIDNQGAPFSLSIGKSTRVVITAGAILTPGLLMRSGIGNADDAKELGLEEPVIILPAAGHNIQDHPAVGIVFEVDPPLNQDMRNDYAIFANWTTKPDTLLREIPATFDYPGFSAGAFLSSGIGQDGNSEAAPDLQLTVFPIMIEPHLPKEVILQSSHKVLVTVAAVNPRTVYRLRKRNNGAPFGDDYNNGDDSGSSLPSIEGQLHPLDVQRLARGVQIVREIFASKPLVTFVIKETVPGAEQSTAAELEAWVLTAHTSNSHWCCSCRMGEDPASSVVDGDLKVRGVDNLFVADASVLPTIPNGNVHSTVVAVASVFAQRLAEAIRAEKT